MLKGEIRRLISKGMVLIALVSCLLWFPRGSAAAPDCCCSECWNQYLLCTYDCGSDCEERYNDCANGCNDAHPEEPVCPTMGE